MLPPSRPSVSLLHRRCTLDPRPGGRGHPCDICMGSLKAWGQAPSPNSSLPPGSPWWESLCSPHTPPAPTLPLTAWLCQDFLSRSPPGPHLSRRLPSLSLVCHSPVTPRPAAGCSRLAYTSVLAAHTAEVTKGKGAEQWTRLLSLRLHRINSGLRNGSQQSAPHVHRVQGPPPEWEKLSSD